MREIDFQIEQFLTNCQVKNLAAKTIKSYNQTLFLLADYLEKELGITDASKVKPIHLTSYITYLQKRGKYTVSMPSASEQPNYPERRADYKRQISKTTINNYIRNMRVFFNFLFDFEIIERNPMKKIQQLRNERKPLDFVSDLQFQEIMKAMDLSKYNEYRDKVIIQLLLDTGMRIGECLAITVEDINFNYNTIFLPWEHTKTKQDRTVFFSLQMSKILKLWLKHKTKFNHSNLLFPNISGGNLAINSFESALRKYTERIGLEITVTPKTFRNNFARRFLKSGGDIFTLSRILGHASVETTQKAYCDITNDELRDGYQQHSPLANMRRQKNSLP